MRSDNDEWDLTESVGVTAVGVAAMRAAESRRPDALFRDPFAERLVAAVSSGWSKLLRGEVEGVTDDEHPYTAVAVMLVARTVYIDDYFAAASAAGVRQVVVLASGLDARAYRLSWPAGTDLFELDLPKVLEFKAAVLSADTPSARRHEVAVDLRGDWPKALRASGFDPGQPTAWLAEGLLRYLPAEAQERLFTDIAALSAPGSRIALNIGVQAAPVADSAAERERRSEVMAEVGMTADVESLWYPWEGRTDPRDWFATHGWTVHDADPATVLTDRGRSVGESARAELSRHILMTAILGEDRK